MRVEATLFPVENVMKNQKQNSFLYSCVIYQKKERKIRNNNIIDNNQNAYMVIQSSNTKAATTQYIANRMACNNLLTVFLLYSGHDYQMHVMSNFNHNRRHRRRRIKQTTTTTAATAATNYLIMSQNSNAS